MIPFSSAMNSVAPFCFVPKILFSFVGLNFDWQIRDSLTLGAYSSVMDGLIISGVFFKSEEEDEEGEEEDEGDKKLFKSSERSAFSCE